MPAKKKKSGDAAAPKQNDVAEATKEDVPKIAGEEAPGDMDDPLAMLGGMGEEQVYKVTAMTDQTEASGATAKETEDTTKAPKKQPKQGNKGYDAAAEAPNAPSTDAAQKTEVDEEAAKAAKREEIAAKVRAAQALREKQEKIDAFQEAKKKDIEEKGPSYYGEHNGITCDACATVPVFGYRYVCTSCASHDICESCYDAWAGGYGVMPNKLAKQPLSTDPNAHKFKLFKDHTFKSVVKGGGPTAKKEPKLKPNDKCNCGSGKKFKVCCMAK